MDIPNEKIAENVQRIEENGFINYFGMQRFGSYSVRTHQIGRRILEHDWKEVVKLILQQHVDYDPDQKRRKEKIVELVFGEEAESLSHFDLKNNIQEAIESLDRKDRLEKTVLQAMKKSPRDYSAAFGAISKGTRFIYIHAY